MLAVGVRANMPILGRLEELISVNGKAAFGKFKMFDTVLYKLMLGGYIIIHVGIYTFLYSSL